MTRTELIRLRLKPADKQLLVAAARQNQQTLSDFLREAINEIIADCHEGGLELRKNKATR